jgi:hypothetical protein
LRTERPKEGRKERRKEEKGRRKEGIKEGRKEPIWAQGSACLRPPNPRN